MDRKIYWYGFLLVLAMIFVAMMGYIGWALALIPGAFLLDVVLKEIFGEDKALDYAIIILIIANLLLAPRALQSFKAESKKEAISMNISREQPVSIGKD